MKTRAKSFLQTFVTMVLLSTLMIGCGKENESGGGSSNNNYKGGVSISGNGNTLPNDWVNRLENEYRCNTGYSNDNSRQGINVQVPGQLNTNANALHVGVTLEGDLLIISSDKNNRAKVELRSCRRPANVNQAQLYTQPVINKSQQCAIGEITAANIIVQSQYGAYELVFFPIGLSSQTSLCTNQYN